MTTEQLVHRQNPALVASLQRREQDAIEQLYREYGSVTFGFLVKTLRDRGAAEDVQQQVFTEVWKRGSEYDPTRAGLLTWIMQITRSRAIDHMRKRVPEPVDPTEKNTTEPVSGDESLTKLHEDWQISFLLAKLPREEAQLLEMRFVEDKSQSEIAEETGIALGTVKMRMVQGLKRLRQLVDAEEGIAL
jgi:RNA polymerase sigma-70 factor (ECF subfamily)